MTQKNKIWLGIGLIIFISIILFFAFNISIFKYRKQVIEEGSFACQNKNINNACYFSIKNKNIIGTCQKSRNNNIVCKPN